MKYYILPAITILVFSNSLFAQEAVEDKNLIKESLSISTNSIEKSGLTQDQIINLDEQTRILLAEFQSTSKEYESLKLYNDQVQKIINSQLNEIENIILKIDELDQTNQRIVPLMLKMIDGLENFIQLDLPFLMTERKDRVINLKTTTSSAAGAVVAPISAGVATGAGAVSTAIGAAVATGVGVGADEPSGFAIPAGR